MYGATPPPAASGTGTAAVCTCMFPSINVSFLMIKAHYYIRKLIYGLGLYQMNLVLE